jgi:hypothetical protein
MQGMSLNAVLPLYGMYGMRLNFGGETTRAILASNL